MWLLIIHLVVIGARKLGYESGRCRVFTVRLGVETTAQSLIWPRLLNSLVNGWLAINHRVGNISMVAIILQVKLVLGSVIRNSFIDSIALCWRG